MDPVLLSLWWVVPGAAGAGAVSWWGLRAARVKGASRLAYDAAAIDIARARAEVSRTRSEVSASRAELLHAQAAREAGTASAADVQLVRRRIGVAQQHARAAASALRAARATRSAAKRELRTRPPGAPTPLERVIGEQAAVDARWMQYETDPALALAFPAMLDARSPATATFVDSRQKAQWLRPAADAKRVTPEQFVAYRDAVRAMRLAFEVAEHEARRQAGAGSSGPGGPGVGSTGERPTLAGVFSGRFETAEDWADSARDLFAWSGDALRGASDQVSRFTEAWRRTRGAREAPRSDDPRPDRPRPEDPPHKGRDPRD